MPLIALFVPLATLLQVLLLQSLGCFHASAVLNQMTLFAVQGADAPLLMSSWLSGSRIPRVRSIAVFFLLLGGAATQPQHPWA